MKKFSARPREKAAAEENSFLHDVLAGLSSKPKWMAAKHFYDAEGSRLFEPMIRIRRAESS